MRKALFLALLASGCYDTSSAPSCRIQCATDSDCTDGLTCGTAGLCTAGEDCLSPATCTPDEFIACVGDMAHSCNATGDGTTDVACDKGCNTTERRCNDCVPDAASCTTDMMSVQMCTSDGRTQNTIAACAAGCNPGDAQVAPHCTYLAPAWLPDICDTLGNGDRTMQSGPFATNMDANCDQIITQMSNGNPIGPQICVIRASTITVPTGVTVTFSGSRAIALVADTQLTMNGTIDVSANQTSHAAGPGVAGSSGVASTASAGGGGAGFGTAGGNGGTTGTGAGGAGGAVIDPLTRAFFAGGYSGGSPSGGNPVAATFGGAGGGGLLLVACRGNTTVGGTIDAGGEGGRPNHDQIAGDGQFTNSNGPSGGGSGGYVVIQGLTVTVSGGIFANGGGGGGGGNVQDAGGVQGQHGLRSLSAASGGAGNISTGGNGGAGTSPGQNGLGATAGGGFGGGGGGGVGVIHMFTPAGVLPVTTGATTSPTFSRKTSVLR